MATAEIAVTESQQAYLSTPISNATITISEPENRPDDNRGGIADCAAIIEDVPLKLKKGGTVAGKPPKKAAVAKAGKAKASRREATRPGGKRKFSKKGRPRK